MAPPVRIGISQCLLGDSVRYDGAHKRDSFLIETLGPHVEWIPVCPEVELGLGTPREAMRLAGDPRAPRLVTITSGIDHTEAMARFSQRRVRELEVLNLSGYVFKKDSPSCGVERVWMFNRHGMSVRDGVGLFARAFMERFPLVPIEDEARLCDPVILDNFIERVFFYHRWQTLARGPLTRKVVVEFHTMHKYILLAHSRQHYQQLGRLVTRADRYRPKVLIKRYGALFMKALTVTATRHKHMNVLQHVIRHMKDQLEPSERAELDSVMEDYRAGMVPLVVPVTLVKHYVVRNRIDYLRDQIYLNPHPKEMKLRNSI